MDNFTYHTKASAPADSAEILDSLEQGLGFVPNIFAVVAESSGALHGLAGLNQHFSQSSFSAVEQQIILMATSVENECVYCVAGHTAFAVSMEMPQEVINAMRQRQVTGIKTYDVLANTVRQLITHRGRVPAYVLTDFIAADFSKAQFLELVMGICVKTFTNYVSNALSISLDEAFSPFAWQRLSETTQKVA
jgi:uncharacterized peroxidase-related enzyme